MSAMLIGSRQQRTAAAAPATTPGWSAPAARAMFGAMPPMRSGRVGTRARGAGRSWPCRLASLAHRRPKQILVATLAVTMAAGVFGMSAADSLHPYGAEDPASDSVRAGVELEAALGYEPAAALVALVDTGAPRDSLLARARVEAVATAIAREPSVVRVDTAYRGGDRRMVSRDGRTQYVAAYFAPISDKAQQDVAARVAAAFAGDPRVKLGGRAASSDDVNATVKSDIARAELLALPLILLLSLLFFRSVVAALLPLAVGGVAIVGAFAVLGLANGVTDVSIFALNITTGLGLGLAIDYSLFVVARYREELASYGPGLRALERTVDTAGRTVVYSSLTVMGALASLLVFPQRFLYSMGIGGVAVTAFAATVAVVVLPAILALLGPRVDALAPAWLQRAAARDARPLVAGGWYRLSRFVMRRPGTIASVTGAALIVAGLPFLGIHFVGTDAAVLPPQTQSRQVWQALERDFAPHRTSPIYALLDTSPREAGAYARSLERLPSVADVSAASPLARGRSLIAVVSRDGPNAAASERLVREIRDVPAPAGVLVGGETAQFVDFKASLRAHLPVAVAIVVVATLLVLFLMTGSVVLPVKALVMNVLTCSAALGLLVLIFQDGRFEGLLGYTGQGGIEATIPVLLFAVVFGLSTDYGVFLLARIKEARAGGAGDREAVAIGLERSGRIVTAAALMFAVAIGAFVTSQIVFIKQNGVGVALAVLIDATIVRALLVPALMELLGRRNWWAPPVLRRLHERAGWREVSAEAPA
jgi:uncharacterized membrane protein YdfJ with MMPL/SSD domain